MRHLLLSMMLVGAACSATGSGAATAAVLPPGATGREVYERSCQRCHALHMPSRFTAGEWGFYVRKYGRRARLTEEQMGKALSYLRANARA